jgi:hypothetical protein
MTQTKIKRGNEFDVMTNTVNFEVPIQTPVAEKKKRKIAIIGTAPQWALAPFDDPEWEIWGIYGVVTAGKRLTRVYELHDRAIIEEQAKKDKTGAYFEKVAAMGENYITKDHFDQAPNASRFDFDSKIKKYGRYFASSAAWLLAQAIDEGVDTIGMWGINMAANEEYVHQKPSCTYLLGYARAKGINIVIPASSELLQCSHLYGYEQPPKSLECLNQKRVELTAALNVHRQNFETSRMGIYGCEQALEMVKWYEQNMK